MTVPVSIMWFRQDLRVKDNPALNAACDMGKIVPIYIYDDTYLLHLYLNFFLQHHLLDCKNILKK